MPSRPRAVWAEAKNLEQHPGFPHGYLGVKSSQDALARAADPGIKPTLSDGIAYPTHQFNRLCSSIYPWPPNFLILSNIIPLYFAYLCILFGRQRWRFRKSVLTEQCTPIHWLTPHMLTKATADVGARNVIQLTHTGAGTQLLEPSLGPPRLHISRRLESGSRARTQTPKSADVNALVSEHYAKHLLPHTLHFNLAFLLI